MELNTTAQLKTKALDLLSRRDYSSQELKLKLLKYTTDLNLIKEVIEMLIASGYLNDLNYAQNFISYKKHKYGNQKIYYLLSQKMGEKIDLAKLDLPGEEEEYNRLKIIWARKYQTFPRAPKEYQAQVRFLLSRGFNYSLIRKLFQSLKLGIDLE